MPILTLSPTAVERVREQMSSHSDCVGVRLKVKVSGCSGYAYVLDFADQVGEDEHRIEQDGAVMVVPEASRAALEGTVVDFVGDGFNRRWSFSNPNAEADCGCGESFALRKEAVSG